MRKIKVNNLHLNCPQMSLDIILSLKQTIKWLNKLTLLNKQQTFLKNQENVTFQKVKTLKFKLQRHPNHSQTQLNFLKLLFRTLKYPSLILIPK